MQYLDGEKNQISKKRQQINVKKHMEFDSM